MKVVELTTLLLCFIVYLSVTGGRKLTKRQAGYPMGPGLNLPTFPYGPSTGQSNPLFGDFYKNFYGGSFPFPTFGPHPTYPPTTTPQDLCVQPPDQSAIFRISSTNSGYPRTLIKAEMNLRADLVTLANNLIPISISGTYSVDHNYTCPSQMMRLRGFWKYNDQCWVLEDIHEINYAVCTQPYCQGCSHSNTRYNRNMCWNHYEKIHVWAYCMGVPNPAQRIVREEIIIPKYCACKNVKCY